MNDQCQEIQRFLRSLPKERKHQIVMVLGQMISYRLTASDSNKEPPTRKGREPSEMVRHDAMLPTTIILGERPR